LRFVASVDSGALEKWHVKSYGEEQIINKKNWHVEIIPEKWSSDQKEFGVAYGFSTTANSVNPVGRMWVRVEKPFVVYRDDFKKDVVRTVVDKKIPVQGCSLFPSAGRYGTKLLEARQEKLDGCSVKFFDVYKGQDLFRDIVAQLLEKYKNKGSIPAPERRPKIHF